LFIGIRNHLNATVERWLDSMSESIWVKILLSESCPLYVCSLYRPPNNDQYILNQLNNAIATLYEREYPQTNLIVAGDFNVSGII